MILSAQQLFSDKQAITATALSTNVIDLGVRGTPYGAAAPVNGDIGKGNSVPLLVQVTEDFNTLTSLTVTVETGATTALGTALISQTVLLADLTAGWQFNEVDLPKGVTGRYVGIRYTVTGTAPTTGRMTAGISMGNQTNTTGA
tara:strand:- start:6710 stop:7141 length:432 start_codon:yes stop_codon:yes gene_type:complete